jgi:hypothetical protein
VIKETLVPKETLEQKVMLVQTDQMVPEDPLVQMEQQELKVTQVMLDQED